MSSQVLRTFLLPVLLTSMAFAHADSQRVQFLGFHSEVPADWVAEEVSSGMRVLQLRVPGEEGEAHAELVVYYFGRNQGGSVEANVERWTSQFSDPAGGAVDPVITKLEGGQVPATLVELEGSYARGVGLGPAAEARPNQMLLAAVVETKKGRLYPQLYGPADLVKGQRAVFITFVEGITSDVAE
jgi:hypothetical protein